MLALNLILFICLIVLIFLVIQKKKENDYLDKTIHKNKNLIQHQNQVMQENNEEAEGCKLRIANLKANYETLKTQLNNDLEAYKETISNQKEELENSINVIMESFLSQEKDLRKIITSHENKIKAYIEEEKRKEEKANKIKFYKLSLSEEELSDINKLMDISKTLSFPDVLRKLVYKTYFEKKMNDLLGRVVGANSEISAIYKITHIESGKAYIGQTTNVKDRWRTHLKRGLNIETPISNKFYQSMISLKPWNFTWEIIETCPKESLNEKEKYWIDFFQTNSWGWNSKGGNK